MTSPFAMVLRLDEVMMTLRPNLTLDVWQRCVWGASAMMVFWQNEGRTSRGLLSFLNL
jgi:hypothetical protein